MTDEAMSPLRRRMIEDMTIRKLAPKTQQGCIRTIKDSLCSLVVHPTRQASRTPSQLHLAANGTRSSSAAHSRYRRRVYEAVLGFRRRSCTRRRVHLSA